MTTLNVSLLQIDLFVLTSVVGIMVLTIWLSRRFPMQSWHENRLAWLGPRDLVIAGERLAQARAYRYMFLLFFFSLGAFTLIDDLTMALNIYCLRSLLRYGGSACIALFALYTSRMNARRRAA